MIRHIPSLIVGCVLMGVAAQIAHAQSASTPGVSSWPADVNPSDAAAMAARIALRQQEIVAEAERTGTLKLWVVRRICG